MDYVEDTTPEELFLIEDLGLDGLEKDVYGNMNYTKLCVNDKALCDITHLQVYKNLKHVDLQKNNQSDLSTLQSMKQQESLDVSDNKQLDLSSLGVYKKQKVLKQNQNELKTSESTYLNQLPCLEVLELSNNNISSLHGLDLANQKTLDISSNFVSSIDMSQCLPNLHTLILDSNLQHRPQFPYLPELRVLSLCNNHLNSLSELTLEHQPVVSKISLNNTKITNFSMLAPLTRLTNLRELSLCNTNISKSCKYRLKVLALFLYVKINLLVLDEIAVTPSELAAAEQQLHTKQDHDLLSISSIQEPMTAQPSQLHVRSSEKGVSHSWLQTWKALLSLRAAAKEATSTEEGQSQFFENCNLLFCFLANISTESITLNKMEQMNHALANITSLRMNGVVKSMAEHAYSYLGLSALFNGTNATSTSLVGNTRMNSVPLEKPYIMNNTPLYLEHIHTLALTNCNQGISNPISALCKFIKHSTNLSVLILNNNQLGGHKTDIHGGVISYCPMLYELCHAIAINGVTLLELSNNNLDDHASDALKLLLPPERDPPIKPLRRLCLANNSIGTNTVNVLTHGIGNGCGLRCLDLSLSDQDHSSLEPAAISVFLRHLVESRYNYMEELLLTGQPLTDTACLYQSQIIQCKNTLKVLDITRCGVSAKGLQYIGHALLQNKNATLTELYAGENCPGEDVEATDEVVGILLRGCSETKVNTLVLDKIPTSNATVRALTSVVKFSSLTQLTMQCEYNAISDDTHMELAAVVVRPEAMAEQLAIFQHIHKLGFPPVAVAKKRVSYNGALQITANHPARKYCEGKNLYLPQNENVDNGMEGVWEDVKSTFRQQMCTPDIRDPYQQSIRGPDTVQYHTAYETTTSLCAEDSLLQLYFGANIKQVLANAFGYSRECTACLHEVDILGMCTAQCIREHHAPGTVLGNSRFCLNDARCGVLLACTDQQTKDWIQVYQPEWEHLEEQLYTQLTNYTNLDTFADLGITTHGCLLQSTPHVFMPLLFALQGITQDLQCTPNVSNIAAFQDCLKYNLFPIQTLKLGGLDPFLPIQLQACVILPEIGPHCEHLNVLPSQVVGYASLRYLRVLQFAESTKWTQAGWDMLARFVSCADTLEILNMTGNTLPHLDSITMENGLIYLPGDILPEQEDPVEYVKQSVRQNIFTLFEGMKRENYTWTRLTLNEVVLSSEAFFGMAEFILHNVDEPELSIHTVDLHDCNLGLEIATTKLASYPSSGTLQTSASNSRMLEDVVPAGLLAYCAAVQKTETTKVRCLYIHGNNNSISPASFRSLASALAHAKDLKKLSFVGNQVKLTTTITQAFCSLVLNATLVTLNLPTITNVHTERVVLLTPQYQAVSTSQLLSLDIGALKLDAITPSELKLLKNAQSAPTCRLFKLSANLQELKINKPSSNNSSTAFEANKVLEVDEDWDQDIITSHCYANRFKYMEQSYRS